MSDTSNLDRVLVLEEGVGVEVECLAETKS